LAESNDVAAKRPGVTRRLSDFIDALRTESPVKKWQLAEAQTEARDH
jgi:hypothetical protein